MPPTMTRAWEEFANNANWFSLHHLDLERFAVFVRTAHHPARYRGHVDFEALIGKAVPAMSEERVATVAGRLDVLYEFGRQVAATSSSGLLARMRSESRAGHDRE